MIYDCFTFFNELDLLEIRLNELNSVVDKFVIVEANRTFQGKPKEMVLKTEWNRFKEFEKKIIYIELQSGYPNFFTRWRPVKAWDIENLQREQFFKGLTDAQDEDTIIISDIDEIPNSDQILRHVDTDHPVVFVQNMYKYYLNCICYNDTWRGPVLIPYKLLKKRTIKLTRLLRDDKIINREKIRVTLQENGGWHFTTVGGVDKIIEKLESFSHTEFNNKKSKDPERIARMIKEGKDILGYDWKFMIEPINDSYPEFIQQNQKKFSHLIKKI